jgi:hypothetical protein
VPIILLAFLFCLLFTSSGVGGVGWDCICR